MDYLALITTDPYYFWQTELLIESFRFHNIEKNLVIGIRSEVNQVSLPVRVVEHERKFMFPPQTLKYEPVNKIYAIYAALASKYVKQPFAVIHPDMVLMNPLPDFTENVIFQATSEDSEIRQLVCSDNALPWLCIDGAAVFNDVPLSFFTKAYVNAQELSNKIPTEKLGKAAWAKTMYQFRELFNLYGTKLEVELIEHEVKAPLIHYRRGMLPYFSKWNYKHFGTMQMDKDPFSVLIENNPTSVTDFVRNIALLYLHNQ